jgi:hypothetical protein
MEQGSRIEGVPERAEAVRPTHDLGLFLVCSVLGLTILSALGAVAIMVCSPSPPTPFSERLFDTFISFAGAGFFTVLGLLAAQGHLPGHR